MSRHTEAVGNLSHLLRLLPRRTRIRSTGVLLAAALSLTACFEQPQSLADYISAICSTPFRSSSAEEAPFLAENVSAMTKMMIDMGIRPSGDVDTDFAAIMTPHHQGAIAMARAELRHGHNEQLRRMAQEIIVTQQQEIVAMRLALGQPPLPESSPPNQASLAEPIDSTSAHQLPLPAKEQ
jgi:ABC-type uncharacterized transport system involved in gliding motility auxiliary subunit